MHASKSRGQPFLHPLPAPRGSPARLSLAMLVRCRLRLMDAPRGFGIAEFCARLPRACAWGRPDCAGANEQCKTGQPGAAAFGHSCASRLAPISSCHEQLLRSLRDVHSGSKQLAACMHDACMMH